MFQNFKMIPWKAKGQKGGSGSDQKCPEQAGKDNGDHLDLNYFNQWQYTA